MLFNLLLHYRPSWKDQPDTLKVTIENKHTHTHTHTYTHTQRLHVLEVYAGCMARLSLKERTISQHRKKGISHKIHTALQVVGTQRKVPLAD